MLIVKQQPHNSVWVRADSQEELSLSFMRFQEHYESVNPDFRGKIFTIGQLRSWYSITYGADTYHKDWIGFNFPSSVLLPFQRGLFDPLTSYETNLLDLFRYRHDNFYIIGAQDQATLRHELSHALYATNKSYRTKIDSILDNHKNIMKKVRQYILDKGYNTEVLNDELQAYITDNEDEFVIKNTPQSIIKKINSLYRKHNNGC